MKLSCQENLLPGDTIADKWAFAQKTGFDGIELIGKGDFALEKRLPELRAAKADGAMFSSVCVGMGNFIGDADREARADAVANLKSQLSVIGELGGVGVVTPTSFGKSTYALPPLKPALDREEQEKVMVDASRELGEHAASAGSVLLLEPLNRYETNYMHTLKQGMALCEAVGLPSVKIMGDVYHMNIEEDDPDQAFRETASVLAHVHICDSNRKEPGCGHIDFSSACSALKEIGFDGFMALECSLRAERETALRNTVEVMRKAMN